MMPPAVSSLPWAARHECFGFLVPAELVRVGLVLAVGPLAVQCAAERSGAYV